MHVLKQIFEMMLIFFLQLQLEEIKENMLNMERFAKETANKYSELSTKQTNRKHLENLKESNLQLKNVSFLKDFQF